MIRSFAVPPLARPFLRYATCAVALFLFVAVTSPSQAQPQMGYWKTVVPDQINVLLDAENPALQERGVDLVMQFHGRSDIALDMGAVRSRLYRIFFDTQQSDELRIMTLSALYATDEKATARVMAGWILEDDPSLRVRRHVRLALAQQQG